jgi:general secretion pathway protein H
MTSRARRRSGFTLLEMLVVLAILGLVAGASSGLMRPPSAHLRVEAAARGLCTAMRTTRSRAIATNEELTLTIDVARKVYSSPAVAETALPLDTGIDVSASVAQHTNRSGAGIVFFPSGRASGADINLNIAGQRATIEVNWLTGDTRCVVG